MDTVEVVVSMEETIWQAILALPDIKDPHVVYNDWIKAHESMDALELIESGFPQDLIDAMHVSCLSNTDRVRRQNNHTLREVSVAAKLLPAAMAPIKRRLIV